MAVTHKLSIQFDEATGAVRVRHFATATIGGQTVTIHEDIPLDDDGWAGQLKALVDLNREEMTNRATASGLVHAAALAGQFKGKQLKFAGQISLNAKAEQKKG